MSTTDTLNVTFPPGSEEFEPVGDLEPGSITTVIRPSRGWIAINWGEFIHSHELFYQTDQLPRPIQYAAALNPMFGIINAYRSSILGSPWDLGPLAISVASTAALLMFGLFFFRKTGRLIADIV